jgi:large subunit ribosomal protein L25
MTDVQVLKAQPRDRVGKGAARQARQKGLVPAVIYGGKQPPQPVNLSYKEIQQRIFVGHFLTTIFEIDVDGEMTRVIPRDYQLDPVRDFTLHVDFLRVTAGATVTVEIPVHFLNQEKSPGIKRGGVLNVVRYSIEMYCPADRIPESIDVDLTGLDLNDSVHISDVKLPEGVRPTIAERDFTVASIAAPAGLKEEAAAAAAAAEEAPAEGGGEAET